jgi:hypothetical protein
MLQSTADLYRRRGMKYRVLGEKGEDGVQVAELEFRGLL